ncbi:MAG TPA: acyl-CoA synthetase, partial [Kiloniellaceae bacterium]|nr:acyl-CoA synthetase [Kiloniellaceae bacterium]
MNLGGLLSQAARRDPDGPALVWGDRSWTWAETNARVNALVAALRRRGLGKGDPILVQARNSHQMFESLWAAFKLGGIWVPTNFRLTPPEVAYIATSSGARVLICDDVFAEHAAAVKAASADLSLTVAIGTAGEGEVAYEDLVIEGEAAGDEEAEVDYHDPCWFFFTSGTTGRPKAAVLTHGQLAFVVNNHLADLMPGTGPGDASLVVAPLSHG